VTSELERNIKAEVLGGQMWSGRLRESGGSAQEVIWNLMDFASLGQPI